MDNVHYRTPFLRLAVAACLALVAGASAAADAAAVAKRPDAKAGVDSDKQTGKKATVPPSRRYGIGYEARQELGPDAQDGRAERPERPERPERIERFERDGRGR